MKKLLTILAALAILASGTANAQVAERLTAHRLDRPWTFSSFVAPTGCVSTSVPFFGASVTLGCDAGLTYDGTAKKLTVNRIGYNAYTTAQRDALTATAGDGIYNSTTGRFEVYDGAAWHGRVRLDGDTMTGDLTVTKGTGTATGRVSNVLNVNTTSQATTGTSEEVLATYTLPANTLSANGKAIRIRAWGNHAANTNATTGRIRFGGIGGTAIATHFSATSNGSWILEAVVVRTGAATQAANGNGNFGTNSPSVSSPTQTLSNAIDIVVTGTTAVAAGDLTFYGMIVEALN